MCQIEGFHQFLSPEYCRLFQMCVGEGGLTGTPGPHPSMGCPPMLMSSCIRVQTCPRVIKQGRKVPLAVPTTILM